MEMKIAQPIFGILLALTKKRTYQNDMKSTNSDKNDDQNMKKQSYQNKMNKTFITCFWTAFHQLNEIWTEIVKDSYCTTRICSWAQNVVVSYEILVRFKPKSVCIFV